jgi:hypothetical protein
MDESLSVKVTPAPFDCFNATLVSLCHGDDVADVDSIVHDGEKEAWPPMFFPFTFKNNDPLLGKFVMETFEIITESKENDLEMMLT